MMGRESGTPQAHATALFLKEQYEKLGLSPGFANGYTQEFSFRGGIDEGPSYVHGKDRVPAIPLPFAESMEASGRAVFAGFCIEDEAAKRNDFEGIDIAGRVVFCLRYGPGGSADQKFARSMSFESKWQACVKRKAAAVVFIGKRGSEPPAPGDLPRRGGRVPAVYVPVEKSGPIAPWFEEEEKKLIEGGSSPRMGTSPDGEFFVSARYEIKQKTGFNVAAYLKPRKAAESDIVIGAHLDHLGRGSFSSMGGRGQIHNGADDNASGTAAVLELARLLQARLKSGNLELPENRNIVFAHFDAEERGLFGSLAMANRLVPGRTILMINLDMVGRLRPDKGLTVQGRDTSDERLKSILEMPDNAALLSSRVKQISGGRGPSDHASFYAKGIPVVFLFTGYHMQYHKPSDDSELINFAGLGEVVNYTAAIASQAARLDPPPQFKQAKDEEERGYSFKLRLGIIPGGYERGGDGLPVGGVQKGAPVARTGIREGDVLVQIGDQKVNDIYDLMEFLEDAEAGVEYRIVFRRGGQTIAASTTLVTE